jgi:DMSO reductase iron-sulfur subunit
MATITQRGFRLDLNKCTGCQACQVACGIENQLAPGTSWRWIDTYNEQRYPGIPLYHLSLACNHCLDPPCKNHCPALAYTKDPSTGVVTIDESLCIGCKYCLWACPYDAPRFDPSAGVVKKCTFCDHRLEEGEDPACVSQCPTGALEAVEVNGDGRDVRGFPRTGASPAIRFLPLRAERPYPEAVALTSSMAFEGTRPPTKVSLRSEWPLSVFSLLTALLAGWVAAGNGGGGSGALAFLGVAVIAAGSSTLHLGQKFRAHRALLNWRNSWLSREILLFSGFIGVSLVHLAIAPLGAVTGWLAAVLGFATLIAIDHVYAVTATRGLAYHSARTLFTGAMILGVALGNPLIFVSVGLLKLFLYTYRKYSRAKRGENARLGFGVVRVGVGLILAGVLWSTGVPALGWLAMVCLALGEIVDRCEFYLELEIFTPRRQMRLDLREDLARRS